VGRVDGEAVGSVDGDGLGFVNVKLSLALSVPSWFETVTVTVYEPYCEYVKVA